MRWVLSLIILCLSVTSASAQAFRDAYDVAVLADSPLIYWRLNDSAYPTAIDISGNNHDGTYAGTTNSVTLQQPPAFSTCGFSAVNNTATGIGENITLADFAGLHLGTGAWTVELLWQTAAGNSSSGCQADGAAFSKGTRTGGFPEVFCGWDGVANGPTISVGSDTFGPIHISHGDWHHEVFVRSGLTSLEWYTDNVNIGPLTISAAADATNTDTLYAWYNTVAGGGNTNTYTLKLDNIAFYNTALNSTQVGNHFTALSTTNVCGGMPDMQYQVKATKNIFGFIKQVDLK